MRVVCELASTTGGGAVTPAKAWPLVVADPPNVPIVEEAASFDVMMLRTPVVLMVACRLFAASAELSAFRVEICPGPVPKVMLVGVPPPVAPIDSVSPASCGWPTLVVAAVRPSLPSAEPASVRF